MDRFRYIWIEAIGFVIIDLKNNKIYRDPYELEELYNKLIDSVLPRSHATNVRLLNAMDKILNPEK